MSAQAAGPEDARAISAWNRLRLIDKYGQFSQLYGFARLIGVFYVVFGVLVLAFVLWQALTAPAPDPALAAATTVQETQLPTSLVGPWLAAVLLALPGYFQVIAPRIRVLRTGLPSPGRVDSVSTSQLGSARSRHRYKQIHWSTQDGTRSGQSFPLPNRTAAGFKKGQPITVYCDPKNRQSGEIDVLGLF